MSYTKFHSLTDREITQHAALVEDPTDLEIELMQRLDNLLDELEETKARLADAQEKVSA